MFVGIIAIFIVVLDQAVKLWAKTTLVYGDVTVIPNVFYLKYAENTGAAFSLFAGQRWFLIAVPILFILAVVLFLVFDKKFGKLGRLGCTLVLGGAIGNLIDRIFHGFVVDLFDFRLINFAIFNVADIFINVGAFLIILELLGEMIHERKNNR